MYVKSKTEHRVNVVIIIFHGNLIEQHLNTYSCPPCVCKQTPASWVCPPRYLCILNLSSFHFTASGSQQSTHPMFCSVCCQADSSFSSTFFSIGFKSGLFPGHLMSVMLGLFWNSSAVSFSL
jgi:hypothetical protein